MKSIGIVPSVAFTALVPRLFSPVSERRAFFYFLSTTKASGSGVCVCLCACVLFPSSFVTAAATGRADSTRDGARIREGFLGNASVLKRLERQSNGVRLPVDGLSGKRDGSELDCVEVG